MDEEYFTDGGFVGETVVYLEGIIVEANDRGFIELRPAPHNVVLEDDSYKGQIKIGLNFFSNKIVHAERRECVTEEKELGQSMCSTITKFWKIPWWRFLFSYKSTKSIDKQKQS
ncbi:unnamed protein product [Ilex paraguariensis]|uniref:Uncharacterized protein n=1 Tax=Ilex paraguariensis TaxID=185542 RepID=A0ABC8REC7_9AQUA